MEGEIVNKVAQSGLITLDLEEMKPSWEIAGFDMAAVLYEGLVLREKDFRAFVQGHDWGAYRGKYVHVHCSTDAIVPTWAYMLLSVTLAPIAALCIFGTRETLETMLWRQAVGELDLELYKDKRVIVKGCSNEHISETIYMELAARLQPVVRSLMFGEPCSTVPLFKK